MNKCKLICLYICYNQVWCSSLILKYRGKLQVNMIMIGGLEDVSRYLGDEFYE